MGIMVLYKYISESSRVATRFTADLFIILVKIIFKFARIDSSFHERSVIFPLQIVAKIPAFILRPQCYIHNSYSLRHPYIVPCFSYQERRKEVTVNYETKAMKKKEMEILSHFRLLHATFI